MADNSGWTLKDLDGVISILKSGAQTVRYQDRTVSYHSLSELLKLRGLMQEELGLTSGRTRRYASFSKGLK